MPTFVFPIKITVIWEASEVLLTHLFKSSSLNAVAKRKGNGFACSNQASHMAQYGL